MTKDEKIKAVSFALIDGLSGRFLSVDSNTILMCSYCLQKTNGREYIKGEENHSIECPVILAKELLKE